MSGMNGFSVELATWVLRRGLKRRGHLVWAIRNLDENVAHLSLEPLVSFQLIICRWVSVGELILHFHVALTLILAIVFHIIN